MLGRLALDEAQERVHGVGLGVAQVQVGNEDRISERHGTGDAFERGNGEGREHGGEVFLAFCWSCAGFG